MFKKKNDAILRQKLPDVKDWFQSYALLNLMKLFLKFLNEKKNWNSHAFCMIFKTKSKRLIMKGYCLKAVLKRLFFHLFIDLFCEIEVYFYQNIGNLFISDINFKEF